MAKQSERKVGIYVRLSKEDSRAGESVSIENQKLLLSKHCRDQGWELVEIFQDDGFSGTNQNRPGMQNMFTAVRQGTINTVLIKDLSRLGRNYLEVGNLAEVFLPEHGCELISLNEKLDEMMVFRNWFNEQHSRETSKKVKAVKKMCSQSGKFIGAYAPYGYQKSPDDKHLLVPDEIAAEVVRRIFKLRVDGMGHKAIAQHLNEAGILPPRDYFYSHLNVENPHRSSHSWCTVTVRQILEHEVYIGNMLGSRYGSVSYKSHKLERKDKDEWIRVENTHQPIIDRELWERAQAITELRYHPHKRKDGSVSIFCGVLYCAECGFKMRSSTQRKTRKNGDLYVHTSFSCGTYSRGGNTVCTPHTIGEEILTQLVTEQIREHARMVECDEQNIVARILEMQNRESTSGKAAAQRELKSHTSRLSMLDKLIEKLYEDRVTGTVPEATFRDLIQKYEGERVSRRETAKELEIRIQSMRESECGVLQWARQIKECTRLETLDTQTLLMLVERIEVSDAAQTGSRPVRDIKILYRFVGDLNELAESGGAADERQAV